MTQTPNKLRVGLLLDSFAQPAWERRMLEQIRNSEYAEIVLIVKNNAPVPARKSGLLAKIDRIFRHRGELVYQLFCNFEQKRFRSKLDPFEKNDTSELLSGIAQLDVVPRQAKFSDWIPDADVETIRSHDLDVFLRLGFRLLRGSILDTAACGVWSYHHGDNRVVRGGPAGFWEAIKNHPWTGIIVQILSEDFDNGQVLYRSYSDTELRSPRLNRNGFYWKGAVIMPRLLRNLHALGRERFQAKVDDQNQNLEFYSGVSHTQPTNVQLLRLAPGLLAKYVKAKFRWWFTEDQWILMYELRDGPATSFWRFKKMVPPKDRFWADPHIIFRNNRYYVFFEECLWASGKGYISLLEMEEDGSFSEPVKILERPYHLSYPFVFLWHGEDYMIPETMDNSTIEVYKCVEFPHKWEFHTTLMSDLEAVDATLFHYQERWWLFANIREHPGISTTDELFLFHSDDPLGTNWVSHPMNPIVSDVRTARPAGKIFERNGAIFRPSQNSTGGYGRGLCLNRIEYLTENEYKERVVSTANPDWDRRIVGLHTYSHEGRLTTIDAKLRRWKW